MNSWFHRIETQYEFKDSKAKYESYLKSSEVVGVLGRTCTAKMHELLKNTLEPVESRFARCHRIRVFGMEATTSGLSEAMHSSMKCGAVPVTSNASLVNSAALTTASSDHRMAAQARKAASEARTTPLFTRSPARDHLIKKGLGVALAQFDLSRKCKGAVGEFPASA